jgi:uncharacterized protein with PIN domain
LIRQLRIVFLDAIIENNDEDLSQQQRLGFVGFDAVHLACAESGKADIFLTTDDRLLKLAKRVPKNLNVRVENPLDWMKEVI